MMPSQVKRNAALLLNTVVMVFFAMFLIYTFYGRAHLNSLARDFVTGKTLAYSVIVVDIAEKALDDSLVVKLLLENTTTMARAEITAFHQSPADYVGGLTGKQLHEMHVPREKAVFAEALHLKIKIRNYYNETLTALINDLRIFALSNMLAAMAGFAMLRHAPPQLEQAFLVYAIALAAAVLFNAMIYVDEMSFFQIMFQTHLGWWYPVALLLASLRFYYALKQNQQGA